MNGKYGISASEEILNGTYKPGQWTQENPEGRKKYGREFLFLRRFYPISWEKPASLRDRDDLAEIILNADAVKKRIYSFLRADTNEVNAEDCIAAREEIFNIAYEPGQWTQNNPEGRKKYARRFLLRLRFCPISLEKPASLSNRDDLKEIILEECIREPKCELCSPLESNEKSVTKKKCAKKKTVATEVAFAMDPMNILTDAMKELCGTKKPSGIAAYIELDMKKVTVVECGNETEEVGSNSDLWTHQNTNGRKKYDRELLLKLHSHPVSLLKPEGLNHAEITLEKDTFEHERCHVCEFMESPEPISVIAKQRVQDPKLLFLV